MPTTSFIKFAYIVGFLANTEQCQAATGLVAACAVCNEAEQVIETAEEKLTVTDERTHRATEDSKREIFKIKELLNDTAAAQPSSMEQQANTLNKVANLAEDLTDKQNNQHDRNDSTEKLDIDFSEVTNSNSVGERKAAAEAKAKEFIEKAKKELGLEGADDQVFEALAIILKQAKNKQRTIAGLPMHYFAGASTTIAKQAKTAKKYAAERLVKAKNTMAFGFKNLGDMLTNKLLKKKNTKKTVNNMIAQRLAASNIQAPTAEVVATTSVVGKPVDISIVNENGAKTLDVKAIDKGTKVAGSLIVGGISVSLGMLTAQVWAMIFAAVGVAAFPPAGLVLIGTGALMGVCVGLLALRKYMKRKQDPEVWNQVKDILVSNGKDFADDLVKDGLKLAVGA